MTSIVHWADTFAFNTVAQKHFRKNPIVYSPGLGPVVKKTTSLTTNKNSHDFHLILSHINILTAASPPPPTTLLFKNSLKV